MKRLLIVALFALVIAVASLATHQIRTAAAAPAFAPVPAATPVAASFSTAVPMNRQSAITLLGSDADSTPLAYAISGSPSHGTLSNLDTAAGVVVYTPAANFAGADSFGYTVTSGGDTSPVGVATVTVTNAKTRIVDSLVDPSGNPRQGKVSFILTSLVTTPNGVAPAGSSVSASLNAQGVFDISIYPSRSMSPESYYQVWLNDASNLSRNQLLGVYDIPAATATITLSPYRVTDANLAARYTFASAASVTALTNAVAAATLRSLLGSTPTDATLQKYDAACDCFKDSNVTSSGTSTTVTGSQTVTTNQTVTGNQTVGGTSTTTGAASVGAGLTVTGNTNVSGNTTVGGSVSATSFSGNGAGLTGIASGTGGITNSGSTTIIADNDANGVGKLSLQTSNIERIGIESDGTVELRGSVIVGGCAGTDDSAKLLADVATAAGGWVIIPNGQTCAGNDISLPAVRVEKGGLLKPVTGHTITLGPNFQAGNYQAFTNALAAQGTISFAGYIGLREVRPEWWGGIPGASATTQMKAAQAAADTGIRVFFSPTINATGYSLDNSSTPLMLNNMTTTTAALEGSGMDVTLISCTSTAHPCIQLAYLHAGSPSVAIRNFHLRGAAGGTPSFTSGNFGIDMPGYISGTDHAVANLIIENVKVDQFGDSGIRLRGLTGPTRLINDVVNDCGNYGEQIAADDNPSPSATQDVTIQHGSIQGNNKGGISIDGGGATVGSITVDDVDIELGSSQTKPALYLKNVFGGVFRGLTLSSTVASLSVGDANIYLDAGAAGNTINGTYNVALGGLHNVHVFGSGADENTFDGGFSVNKSAPPSGLGYKAKVTSGRRNTFDHLFSASGSFASNHSLVLEMSTEGNDSILGPGEKKMHGSDVFRQPTLVFAYETTWQPNGGSSIANLTSVHTSITVAGAQTTYYAEVHPLLSAGGLVDCFFTAYVENTDTIKVSMLNATGSSKTFSAAVPLLIKVYSVTP